MTTGAAGSDAGAGCQVNNLTFDTCPSDKMFLDSTTTLQEMLSTDKTFNVVDVYSKKKMSFKGANLDPAIMQKINRDNFLKLLGANNKKLDCKKAADHINYLITFATDATAKSRGVAMRDEIAKATCP